mmetsp:Transcript_43164/g.91826  ORF Transcript_43164/g.91826 Transcript_43164/m.91826 type:complete len:262 (+) Transcript_43164:79-864(+)
MITIKSTRGAPTKSRMKTIGISILAVLLVVKSLPVCEGGVIDQADPAWDTPPLGRHKFSDKENFSAKRFGRDRRAKADGSSDKSISTESNNTRVGRGKSSKSRGKTSKTAKSSGESMSRDGSGKASKLGDLGNDQLVTAIFMTPEPTTNEPTVSPEPTYRPSSSNKPSSEPTTTTEPTASPRPTYSPSSSNQPSSEPTYTTQPTTSPQPSSPPTMSSRPSSENASPISDLDQTLPNSALVHARVSLTLLLSSMLLSWAIQL